ncbi:beta-lactamase family protein [Paraglaciecola aquimarina]|uniref:Beta-lactamase family protein n=1 Tax=Paraglaciecola algarum TaxID=3050085 RepID=A0ABS9D765_9ALTE|nr:serine hydrolase [Paraglaciecola sp. G1-23]MCF2948781.1 beta-lactamase family protein [Paraglaciecola sp. G1-23]
MLKKLSISLVVVLIFIASGLRWLGISVFAIDDALGVSTGLGAKIACSGKFVGGLSEAQIVSDLAGYSPANNLLDIYYHQSSVSTNFLGLSQASATYRKGLGCTLDNAQATFDLNSLTVPSFNSSSLLWPAGETVNSIDTQLQAVVDEIMAADKLAGLDTRALLVVKDGQILAEAYGSGFDQNTPLLGWSMGKSLTAIMLGHAVTTRQIDLNSTQLFTPWKGDQRNQISLKSLLQMSSGLEFDENYIPGTDATRMLFLEPSTSQFALHKPSIYQVGEHFHYSSGTTNILMRYLFDSLGGDPQTLINYFYEQIAQPLGMANTVFEVDAEGIFVGSSYIFSSARDWARMGLLMVNQGVINNQKVLSREWVEAATTPNESLNDGSYGFQFWLNTGGDAARWPDLPEDTYAMLGNRKQRVMIFPTHNTVIVRLGWDSSYPDDKNFSKILAALN